jgi:hypothetical protein
MRGLCWLIALSSVGAALAAEPLPSPSPPSPAVLLLIKGNIGVRDQTGPGDGLVMNAISAWATSSVNKHSTVRVERFQKAMGEQPLDVAAGSSFGCFAATTPCAGAEVFTDAEKFGEALKARSPSEGFVVEITPELAPEQLMFRAVARRMRLANDVPRTPIRTGNGYVAVYTTRAPPALAAQIKSNPAALEAYWAEGEPRRLVSAAQRGLVEIDALLAHLVRDGDESGAMPQAWKALPKVKEVGRDRVACSGPSWCAVTRVLEDRGDSFVLVSGGNTAGWFDAAAAAKDANLPAFAQLGIRWN